MRLARPLQGQALSCNQPRPVCASCALRKERSGDGNSEPGVPEQKGCLPVS